jgi:hypothetical protein
LPKVRIEMERHRFIACELASSGYGDVDSIMRTRVDLVMDAYDYLHFRVKYEDQIRASIDRKGEG